MKKLYYVISSVICMLLFGFLLSSCSLDDDTNVTPQEKALNLTTTTGEQLAQNMNALKKSIGKHVAARIGRDIDFTITAIEHVSIANDSYAAIVKYETTEGDKGNVIYTNAGIDKNNMFMSRNTPKSRFEYKVNAGEKGSVSCTLIENKKCDPGCGSGNLTLHLSSNTWEATCDCDTDICRVSVTVERI